MRAPLKLLALAVAATVSLPACGGRFEGAAAVVDGQRIDDARMQRQLEFLLARPLGQGPEGAPDAEERREFARQFLTFLIHQRLLDRYAEAREIGVTGEEIDRRLEELFVPAGDRSAFEDLLERSGATADDVRDLVRQQIVRERVFDTVVGEELTEDGLREEYERRIPDFTQLDLAHILVSDRARAESLADRATVGNFGELAERFSEDPASAERGGELGVARPGDYVEEFARAAMAAEVGTIVGPVETEFGFHLIHVRSRETVPFDSVADSLRQQLGNEAFGRWLLDRVQEADIRVNPRYGVFDRERGQVVERRSTADQPEPQPTP